VRVGYLPDVPASQKRLLQLGFLPGEPNWWSYGWGFVFGGQLLQGDKITAAAPENVRAYRWVASYSKKIGVDAIKRFRSGFGNFGTAENPFLSSRLAMQIQGVWMYNFIKKFADGMPWGAAPFPAPSDRPELRGVANSEADNLVIPAASRHPEEAWEFIKYVQSQPVMEQLCLGQRKHSPLSQVSDEFWDKHPNPYIRLFAELGSLPHAWAAPKTGIWNEYSRELDAMANRIQSLSITPEQGLLQIQESMQRSLDRELAVQARRSE
jgi:ABC-type glycerol-3-phosphate transport system substrate-binding protein